MDAIPSALVGICLDACATTLYSPLAGAANTNSRTSPREAQHDAMSTRHQQEWMQHGRKGMHAWSGCVRREVLRQKFASSKKLQGELLDLTPSGLALLCKALRETLLRSVTGAGTSRGTIIGVGVAAMIASSACSVLSHERKGRA